MNDNFVVFEKFIKDVENIKSHIDEEFVINSSDLINKIDTIIFPKLKSKLNEFINYDYDFCRLSINNNNNEATTLHRDVKKKISAKYLDIYTLVLYLDDADFMIQNKYKEFKTIKCKSGDAILFNSHTLHSAIVNDKGKKRTVLQIFNICSIDTMKEINNINSYPSKEIINKGNDNWFFKKIRYIIEKYHIYPYNFKHKYINQVNKIHKCDNNKKIHSSEFFAKYEQL